MNRRDTLLALAVFGITPVAVRAQPAEKIPRIALLSAAPFSSITSRTDAFRKGLGDLGYAEGKNIAIEWRAADDHWDRLPGLVAELVRLKVAVIVAAEGPAAVAAWRVTKAIPIVMGQSGDPVAMGVVGSLARPGGNVTGLTTLSTDLPGKQVELLKEALPRLARLAVLSNPANPLSTSALGNLEPTVRALRLKMQVFDARSPGELEAAFPAMSKARAEGVVVLPDPMFLTQRKPIAELAAAHHLPAIYGIPEHAHAGGLMAYAASRTELFRRAAIYVDKILKGSKAAELPVEQPTTFELVINLKTAKLLGVKIPSTLLTRADSVLQ